MRHRTIVVAIALSVVLAAGNAVAGSSAHDAGRAGARFDGSRIVRSRKKVPVLRFGAQEGTALIQIGRQPANWPAGKIYVSAGVMGEFANHGKTTLKSIQFLGHEVKLDRRVWKFREGFELTGPQGILNYPKTFALRPGESRAVTPVAFTTLSNRLMKALEASEEVRITMVARVGRQIIKWALPIARVIPPRR
ncbi:MAG: hypothetical protein HYT79_07070 [Elusimicrobia bacterium]|nr:hypothetical protein [Elusimicrobiota bacterium]